MKKEYGICQYCGEERKLIQAHIIPHSFMNEIKKADKTLLMISLDKQCPTQSGIFDTSILCAKCDNTFSSYEKEALKLFKLDLNNYKQYLYENGQTELYYKIPNLLINAKKIQLFFLSVLWKSSITKSTIFSKVTLAKYEDIFKNCLKQQIIPDCFSVILSYYQNTALESSAKTLHHPGRHKMNGVNFYEFYFNGFDVRIKVDNRKHSFDIFKIKNEEDIVIINRENFKNGPQYRGMINILKD